MPENIIKNICGDLNLVLSESGENYGWEVIRARTKFSVAEKIADAKLKASLFTGNSSLHSSSENYPLKMETIIILNFTWQWEDRSKSPSMWTGLSAHVVQVCVNIYLPEGSWAVSVWWGWWGWNLWKVAGTDIRMVIMCLQLKEWNTWGLSWRVNFPRVKSSFYCRLLDLKSVCSWNAALNVKILESFRMWALKCF